MGQRRASSGGGNFCINCGRSLGGGQRFCPGCGLRPSQRHLPRTKRLLQLLISLFMPGIKEQTFLAHSAIQIVHL